MCLVAAARGADQGRSGADGDKDRTAFQAEITVGFYYYGFQLAANIIATCHQLPAIGRLVSGTAGPGDRMRERRGRLVALPQSGCNRQKQIERRKNEKTRTHLDCVKPAVVLGYV